MSADLDSLLQLLKELHKGIRDQVLASFEQRGMSEAAAVFADGEGDTQYGIDGVSEEYLMRFWRQHAQSLGGVVLVAEGIEGGRVVLPAGTNESDARWLVIVDPIDGTRGLMYQKRSAWVLSAVAPNRGHGTRLSHVVLSLQTEIPTLKQHLSDQLWLLEGQAVKAERENRLTGESSELVLTPSSADSVLHGYAMISRFFPGARDELASIDEALMLRLLGPSPKGKALCFEDQYASTGGQLYELMAGHDRFNADLRPALIERLRERGHQGGLCCHPYDLCTARIAQALGVVVTDMAGATLDMPLDVNSNVSWIGYANERLRKTVEPTLLDLLEERGLSDQARSRS